MRGEVGRSRGGSLSKATVYSHCHYRCPAGFGSLVRNAPPHLQTVLAALDTSDVRCCAVVRLSTASTAGPWSTALRCC